MAPVQASPVVHDSVVSEAPVAFTPHLYDDGSVRPRAYTINQAGDHMVVGGRIRAVENAKRTQQFARSNVFAFHRTTGAISDFAPDVNGVVWSVLGDGDDVYIGGEFTSVNGTSTQRLAKLSLSTGQVDPNFKPKLPGGRVSDLQLVDGRLIVSGAFRKNLVALNPSTGADTKYLQLPVTVPLEHTTRTEVFRFDVSPDGSKLVGVGNFRQVDGQPRSRVFMADLGTTATLSPWNYPPSARNCHAATTPKYQVYIRDVDFSPDSQYFNLASTGGHRINGEGPGQVLCDTVARFDVNNASPTVPFWINYAGGDTLHSVIDTGAAVYVQGHSRWLDNPYGADYAGPGAVDRLGGGAVDPVTGKALPWNPVMPQKVGGYQMFANEQGVWFVTDGNRFNKKYRRGIRMAPVI